MVTSDDNLPLLHYVYGTIDASKAMKWEKSESAALIQGNCRKKGGEIQENGGAHNEPMHLFLEVVFAISINPGYTVGGVLSFTGRKPSKLSTSEHRKKNSTTLGVC